MSEGVNLQFGAGNGYRVQNVEGCMLTFGPVPIRDLTALQTKFSKRAIVDTDIADLIGASMVMGEPEDIERLRQSDTLRPSAQRYEESNRAKYAGLPDGAVEWLLNGDRGMSSNAMFAAIFGVDTGEKRAHPYDPADLRRCMQMLEACEVTMDQQAKDRVAAMSPTWKVLMDYWESIMDAWNSEVGQGRMPATYNLLQRLLSEASKGGAR